MNLRPRLTQPVSGFTKAEVKTMEHLLDETEEESLGKDFFKDLANDFNHSINRAGKSRLKWTEIRSWFEKNQQKCLFKETSFDSVKKSPVVPESLTQKPKIQSWFEKNQENCLFKETSYDAAKKSPDVPEALTLNPKMPEGDICIDASAKDFEARSKDGAWYDVEAFLTHRELSPGEVEVCIRYLGFGAEDDEWVNVKKDVRVRSVPFDHSECQKLKIGDLVVCFQERKHESRYYDGHVMEIERKLHDVRGCRCLFLIRYEHDNTQEKVPLKRLCGRPIARD